MCEITESESMERRLDSLAAENEQLRGKMALLERDIDVGAGNAELLGLEVERLKAENTRLLRDRRRVSAFIGSDAWDAMNERRAELIGRDTDGGLSDAERAELATLQLAVDVLIGVRHPLPGPDDGKWKDALIRSAQAEVERLRERAERAEREREVMLKTMVEHDPTYPKAPWVVNKPWGYRLPHRWYPTEAEARAAAYRALGLDAEPAGGMKTLTITPEQYELGYAVPCSFPIQGGTPIRREPYRLIRRLPDGNYLIEDPSASGTAGEESK